MERGAAKPGAAPQDPEAPAATGDAGGSPEKFGTRNGYGSIPIHTIFSGMNIHLPAILGFTRYQGFDPSPNRKKQKGTLSGPHFSTFLGMQCFGYIMFGPNFSGAPPIYCNQHR